MVFSIKMALNKTICWRASYIFVEFYFLYECHVDKIDLNLLSFATN